MLALTDSVDHAAPASPDDLLDQEAAARFLSVTVRELARMRAAGIGPSWRLTPDGVMWRRANLETYLSSPQEWI